MRIVFPKGEQRKFLNKVLFLSSCPSLRGLIFRGFDIPYSTLKSYYVENRTLPESLFWDLCAFSGLNEKEINFSGLNDSWGQSKGGKK
jgi:hypothetical protein